MLTKMTMMCGAALAGLLLAGAAQAQNPGNYPTYTGSSVVYGQTNINGRHRGCVWTPVAGGDYSQSGADMDAPGGVARGCALAVVTIDPVTGLVASGGGGGGSAPSGTVGSAFPATVSPGSGKNPAGNVVGLALGTNGGVIPSQVDEAQTRTTLTASTITAGPAASARIGISWQVEAALTAPLYICTAGQSGTCSATVYNYVVPNGAAAGTLLTDPFASQGAVYYFSTGTPTVNANVATVR